MCITPQAFDQEDVCLSIASSGVVSHLVALVDTAPSPLELATALRIIFRLVTRPKAAIKFVTCSYRPRPPCIRSAARLFLAALLTVAAWVSSFLRFDGLRVMVELTLMQQFTGDSLGAAAAPASTGPSAEDDLAALHAAPALARLLGPSLQPNSPLCPGHSLDRPGSCGDA